MGYFPEQPPDAEHPGKNGAVAPEGEFGQDALQTGPAAALLAAAKCPVDGDAEQDSLFRRTP